MTDLSHEIELSPAFHDLDPMDIVWHGNYAKYLEIARNALMAKFDYDYPQMRAPCNTCRYLAYASMNS